MAEDTLTRVQDTIRNLNYRPNGVARGLVNRRTATIGLILSEIETPLFIQSLNVIEPIARSMGYNVLVCNARSFEDERQAIDLLLEKEVEGFIFLSTSVYTDNHHISDLIASGCAAVFINRTMPHHQFDQINWDNAAGITAAVEHLIRLGHRRIAHLQGPQDRRSSAERRDGYERGLAQAGIGYREEYVQSGDYTATWEIWQASTRALLALTDPPTAIIAADDLVAAVTMKTVQRAGLRVPHDVAIVGSDDQFFDIFLNPALTTVQLPVIEASTRAIRMLLDRIAGRRTGPDHVMLPCPLIIRESCGAVGSCALGAGTYV